MPEPTSAALAACTAATSCLAVVATAMGVPAPMVLASVLGATVSVSQQDKMQLTVRSLLAAALALALSMGLGIWGGTPAGRVMVGLLNGLISDPALRLSADACDPFATLLLAMLGVPVLLPLALGALRSRVGEGGSAPGNGGNADGGGK
jgi:hypothetical protein